MPPYGGDSSGERDPLVQASGFRRRDDSDNPLFRTVSTVAVITLAIILVICAVETAYIIPPGMVGIVVTLGKVDSRTSGLHFRFPMVSSLEILSTQTQLLEEKNVIPTKEGLSVTLDTAVLFRLDPTRAAELYREVGSNYVDVLIKPEASSAVRGLTSESEAKALYSSGRTIIQDSLKEELEEKLGARGIIVEDVLLKDIILPDQLSKAIELKVQAEQEAARMEFVLQKEQQEAERKAIEAGGIADFQKIVSQGISAELLKWKGIEATEKFAGAPNTKIVIMGNSESDLPVILSADSNDGPTGKESSSPPK